MTLGNSSCTAFPKGCRGTSLVLHSRRAIKDELVRYNIHVLSFGFQQILPFSLLLANSAVGVHFEHPNEVLCPAGAHAKAGNRSVLHQNSWAAGGLAFQAEDLDKWKGSPHLVDTRVPDEN